MAVCRYFLADQFHREDRGEVIRADWLVSGGMERGIERRGQVCLNIIPLLGYLLLIKEDLGLHARLFCFVQIYTLWNIIDT